MATPEAPAASAQAEPNHGMRIFLIWLPLALIADLLIWFVWYPHLPPGACPRRRATSRSTSRSWRCAPRRSCCSSGSTPRMPSSPGVTGEGDDEDGPPIHGNTKIQATWIGATSVIVLGLFVFGTDRADRPGGRGRGRGARADLEAQHPTTCSRSR